MCSQLANLAAQVSEEQAAISAGLSQVQEQVAAATSAAMDAATCAQLVQQAQAEQGSRADPTEALQEVQDQLREQVRLPGQGCGSRGRPERSACAWGYLRLEGLACTATLAGGSRTRGGCGCGCVGESRQLPAGGAHELHPPYLATPSLHIVMNVTPHFLS